MTLASPDVDVLILDNLPAAARGIYRALVRMSNLDTAGELAVWDTASTVQGRTEQFDVTACRWIAAHVERLRQNERGRAAARQGVELVSSMTYDEVRAEVGAAVATLGNPGSDLLILGTERVLRFRFQGGAWYAYSARAVDPKAAVPPERARWTQFPDARAWPETKVDTYAERIAAGLEPDLTADMRVEEEKRLCWLHHVPLKRCACPAMVDVLVGVFRARQTPAVGPGEDVNEELSAAAFDAVDEGADPWTSSEDRARMAAETAKIEANLRADPTPAASVAGRPSTAGATSSVSPPAPSPTTTPAPAASPDSAARQGEPATPASRSEPDPTPAGAGSSGGPAPGTSPSSTPTSDGGGSGSATTPQKSPASAPPTETSSAASGSTPASVPPAADPRLAGLPARFEVVSTGTCCTGHVLCDDPGKLEHLVCPHGGATFAFMSGDPSRPGPDYAKLLLGGALGREIAPRGCVICGHGFDAQGEPPVSTVRGGKLLIAAHVACLLEHAPPAFVLPGNNRPCASCRRPIASPGEAVIFQFPGRAFVMHRDTKACVPEPSPQEAAELTRQLETPWKDAEQPAGRKLKAPCARCGKEIAKGQRYQVRGDDRRHADPCEPAAPP